MVHDWYTTHNTNKTHISVHKTNNQVISGHISHYMRNEFNLVVDKENKKFPKIYWTPKLYQYSSKTRFIKTAPKCSVKPLSLSFSIETCILDNRNLHFHIVFFIRG